MEPITLRGIAGPELAANVKRAILSLPQGDRVVEVTIRKPRTQRSLSQNAYWHAVPVKILAEHCGYTDSQMHYALLGECFGYEPGPNGQPIPLKPSSADLSVEEFTHLIEWVLRWAASELEVTIPAPEEAKAA